MAASSPSGRLLKPQCAIRATETERGWLIRRRGRRGAQRAQRRTSRGAWAALGTSARAVSNNPAAPQTPAPTSGFAQRSTAGFRAGKLGCRPDLAGPLRPQPDTGAPRNAAVDTHHHVRRIVPMLADRHAAEAASPAVGQRRRFRPLSVRRARRTGAVRRRADRNRSADTGAQPRLPVVLRRDRAVADPRHQSADPVVRLPEFCRRHGLFEDRDGTERDRRADRAARGAASAGLGRHLHRPRRRDDAVARRARHAAGASLRARRCSPRHSPVSGPGSCSRSPRCSSSLPTRR